MHEKLNFVKINFINCECEYTFTICEFSEIGNQIESVESDFDIRNYPLEKGKRKPRISITLIQLTKKEYDDWQFQLEENS